MNKGIKHSSFVYLHFLNSGDEVFGNPYSDLNEKLLKSYLIYSNKMKLDKIKLFNHGYVHQGIIFKNRYEYNINYKISADFEYIIKNFKKGLSFLPKDNYSYIKFYMDGLSSKNFIKRDIEILKILFLKKNIFYSFLFLLILIIKTPYKILFNGK